MTNQTSFLTPVHFISKFFPSPGTQTWTSLDSGAQFSNHWATTPPSLGGGTTGLLTKRKAKMAGYFPSSFLSLETETDLRSINMQNKNDNNIQPS